MFDVVQANAKNVVAAIDLFIGAMLCFYVIIAVFNVFLGNTGSFDREWAKKYWRRILVCSAIAALLILSAVELDNSWLH